MSCYQILGAKYNDTYRDICKKYRTLAKELHPDKNSAPDATVRFQQLHAAFEMLTRIYELKLHSPSVPPPPTPSPPKAPPPPYPPPKAEPQKSAPSPPTPKTESKKSYTRPTREPYVNRNRKRKAEEASIPTPELPKRPAPIPTPELPKRHTPIQPISIPVSAKELYRLLKPDVKLPNGQVVHLQLPLGSTVGTIFTQHTFRFQLCKDPMDFIHFYTTSGHDLIIRKSMSMLEYLAGSAITVPSLAADGEFWNLFWPEDVEINPQQPTFVYPGKGLQLKNGTRGRLVVQVLLVSLAQKLSMEDRQVLLDMSKRYQ